MNKLLIMIGLLMMSLSSIGQTQYAERMDTDELVLEKMYLTISYSKQYKEPYYVGYMLLPSDVEGDVEREHSFHVEWDVPKEYRASTLNYTKTGYDRGHMSPAADWRGNREAMHESFSLANVCPQCPRLNRNYWKKIETMERDYAKLCDTLFIITGALCDGTTYIRNGVGVPKQFYKTIVGVKDGRVVLSIAWLFDNINTKQAEQDKRTSISAIEQLTGKDLYRAFWFNGMVESKIMQNILKVESKIMLNITKVESKIMQNILKLESNVMQNIPKVEGKIMLNIPKVESNVEDYAEPPDGV